MAREKFLEQELGLISCPFLNLSEDVRLSYCFLRSVNNLRTRRSGEISYAAWRARKRWLCDLWCDISETIQKALHPEPMKKRTTDKDKLR